MKIISATEQRSFYVFLNNFNVNRFYELYSYSGESSPETGHGPVSVTWSPENSKCSFFLLCSKDMERLIHYFPCLSDPMTENLTSLIRELFYLIENCFAAKSLRHLEIRSLTLSERFYHTQL